jgi:ABC-type polysaccharide/polyol phosphate transport system ATPase subunit
MTAISLRGIGKKYRIFPSRQDHLKEILSFGRIKRSHDFWALEDINLDVAPGTTLGILGRNGAGKTTLLRIISGIVAPTTGTVEVNGRLAALFGTGAGFNPEFTGRDNALLNGLLLGIDRKEMLERFDEIEAFADIGEFIDQPVKTYSSGMRSRLGFAVAVNVDPDILVIDETLSAGDAVFKQMAFEKMRELLGSGTTILFVSHSLGMVRSFCNRAVLLHKGKMISSGDVSETLERYEALVSDIKARNSTRSTGSDGRLGYEIEHEDEESADGSRTAS